MSTDTNTSVTIGADRITHPQIIDLRYNQHTGRLEMARYWQAGTEHGIEWTEVPNVDAIGVDPARSIT